MGTRPDLNTEFAAYEGPTREGFLFKKINDFNSVDNVQGLVLQNIL
jgi:hypothetical protein